MTPPATEWRRVSRELPCPVCGKADWCLVTADGTACICPRTESTKRCGDAGYLHRLVDTPRPRVLRRVVFRSRPAPPDLTALAGEYQRAATAERLTALAEHLHVPVASLTAFAVGWAADRSAWSFPMRDPATGTVTGIRLRKPDGTKFSVRGGREALFLPDVLTTDDVLLVTEGATDAVAAHAIGFPLAVGRPSCTGGTTHLVALVRTVKPDRAVIVRDNDEPGVRGADSLAAVLALHCRCVCVIAPPDGVKDVRAWVAAGATRPDVEHLIRPADARRLNTTVTTKGTT
jgi:hypothetical protein